MEELQQLLESTTLQTLIVGKQKLTEVPHTASVAETLRIMHESSVSAVAVVAPPCSDGSSCAFKLPGEQSKQAAMADGAFWAPSERIACSVSRGHGPPHGGEGLAPECYAGIVSACDILNLFAELKSKITHAGALSELFFDGPIRRCIKGASLCVLSPHSSVLDTMDEMINGLQRALVPHTLINEGLDHDDGEGTKVHSGYSMVTQTDIIRFFQMELEKLKPILHQSVEALQAYQSEVLGVWKDIPVVDAIRCMHKESLCVVPILDVGENVTTTELTPAKGKPIAGSFSATDLKRFTPEAIRSWAHEGLLIFLKRILIMEKPQCSVEALDRDANAKYSLDLIGNFAQFELVSCILSTSLEEVICMALPHNVQRVWVVEKDFVVVGVISFMDILKVVRRCLKQKQRGASIQSGSHD